ncbi:uncharacterized protein LOC121867352 [Homarus americanus]|uniref:uncharacterized protein LOC121867352 n=1 Tax=Homarus americanus TaxID=6706 RepID=UPI001C4801BC|nr:uncharacterized protein LOC121867352 [Homarus americanus]
MKLAGHEIYWTSSSLCHPTGVRNVIFVRTGDSTDPGRGRRSNRGCGGARRYESETARTVGARERSGRRHSGTEDEDARRLRTKTLVDCGRRHRSTREEDAPEHGKNATLPSAGRHSSTQKETRINVGPARLF